MRTSAKGGFDVGIEGYSYLIFWNEIRTFSGGRKEKLSKLDRKR